MTGEKNSSKKKIWADKLKENWEAYMEYRKKTLEKILETKKYER